MVRLELVNAKNALFIQADPKIYDRVSGHLVDGFVVPEVCVEEPFLAELGLSEARQLLLAVLLEQVDTDDQGTGGHHRRLILEEAEAR